MRPIDASDRLAEDKRNLGLHKALKYSHVDLRYCSKMWKKMIGTPPVIGAPKVHPTKNRIKHLQVCKSIILVQGYAR